MKPIEVNVSFLYHFETSENHIFFMLLGSTKGNIDPKWVNGEWHNFMLLA